MQLVYCYDAYCGWCYGFSLVIKKIANEYKDTIPVEVLSGGMILPKEPVHISASASYIEREYPRVEELTGIMFGKDYLWHIKHPNESDWYPNSEKPAIALCIFKEMREDSQVEFAADLQFALHYEGRDLTDDEAYRHLLVKYEINEEEFYRKLKSEEYKDKAHYEFSLVKQLQVTGFPALLMQINDSKFYLIARGFTPYEDVRSRIESVMNTESSGKTFD